MERVRHSAGVAEWVVVSKVDSTAMTVDESQRESIEKSTRDLVLRDRC